MKDLDLRVSCLRPVVVVGAGGHAAVVYEALMLAGPEVVGHTANSTFRLGEVPFLGDNDAFMKAHPPEKYLLANGVGAKTPDDDHRRVYERFRERGYEFTTVIHPSATVSPSSRFRFSDGTVIMAGAIIQAGCLIGKNVIINTGAQLDHHTVIRDHVHIGPGAVLCGGVTVDEGAMIGAGAVVVPLTRITAGTLIPSGSIARQADE